MHPDANQAHHLCTLYRCLAVVGSAAARKSHPAANPATAPVEVVREATRVERLAYTRSQAAEALGVSRSTCNRRVLPLIDTVEMPWGTRLIPVDEVERLPAERRRPARAPAPPAKRDGREPSRPTS
jgi:hypothetical protein